MVNGCLESLCPGVAASWVGQERASVPTLKGVLIARLSAFWGQTDQPRAANHTLNFIANPITSGKPHKIKIWVIVLLEKKKKMGLYTYAHVFCGRRCDADVFAGIGYLLQLLSTLMKSIFFKAALPKKKKNLGLGLWRSLSRWKYLLPMTWIQHPESTLFNIVEREKSSP